MMKPLRIKALIVIFYWVAIIVLLALSCQSNCVEVLMGALAGFVIGIGLSIAFSILSGGRK